MIEIKKRLALIAHSHSGKVSEIRDNLKRLGVNVPNDLRSRKALESIAVSKNRVTKATDSLPKRD